MIFKGNKYKDPFKVHYKSKYTVLTESALPGTTLDLVNIEEVKTGLRFIDTPGIPNLN